MIKNIFNKKKKAIFFLIIIILLILIFTPLNKLVLGNIIGRFFSCTVKILNIVNYNPPFDKEAGILPIFPKLLLKKHGLVDELMRLPMPAWKNMKLNKRFISIEGGLNAFSIGKKTFWAKTSFLDPNDSRYHLWYGIYIIPLNNVYELKKNRLEKINIYGYDINKEIINIDEIFLIAQYDYYNFVKKRTIKYVRENNINFHEYFKFKNNNIYLEKSDYKNNHWILSGTAENRNLLNRPENIIQTILHSATGGWIPKNNEKNLAYSTFKGRLVPIYRDKNGHIVSPESEKAEVLTIGYVFGIYWDNGNKETSDKIMDELADSFIKLDYNVVK